MRKELILGPPGTGKTTALLDIVDELLSDGVPAERIAYVSFTNAATDEAKERARARFNLPASHFENFRTLHSTAWRSLGLSQGDLMRDYHWEDLSSITGRNLVPMGALLDGISEDRVVCAQLHLAKALGRDYGDHFLRCIRSKRALNAREFHFGAMWRGGSHKEFVSLGRAVEDYKTSRAIFDFNDMLIRGADCEPLDVDYAIIDEAQDLTPIQWRFARKAFSKCKTIYMAGDDDQAIYTWAGADLYTFRHMEAHRRVLGHSWRLPRLVWMMANNISAMIEDRYQKEWTPRDEEGEVRFIHSLEDLPLENGESWYLLTRTNSLQQRIARHLRHRKMIFRQNGNLSVKPEHMMLARVWNRLIRGQHITVGQARELYQNLTEQQVDFDSSRLDSIDSTAKLRINNLQQDHGLKVERGQWYEVLALPQSSLEYYRAVGQAHGVDVFEREPAITVSTIHGVKGGEADNVYFSTSMGKRPWKFFKKGYTQDDEARIFYVAATRARKRLYIDIARQNHFPIPLKDFT